jgi:hypothetical protein
MSAFVLASPREADDLIARLFLNEQTCILSAREDMAFKGEEWFDFGRVDLFPIPGEAGKDLLAVRRGQYEWKLPTAEEAKAVLEKILVGPATGTSPADKARRERKLRRSLDGMAGIAARVGLFHPRFDSHSLAMMPYRRPLSIVADTSGIAQGGLDFVARFLSPIARTKVPAIAQMEVVNFSHRFLSNSRSGDVKGLDLLIDHLLSQGAQRVLLRLEMQSDIEIERTFLLGDPLRSAFAKDDDKDIKSLNLSTDVPSYADRMIIEAARHHQMQGGPGHQVQLLTSDHGLAKMALSEGIIPLYFRSVENAQLFGRKLTGANLHPFGGQLQCTPLSMLLWECAVAFGRAKLQTPDGKQSLEVAAFGKEFTWSPYHSRGDLLWMDGSSIGRSADPSNGTPVESTTIPATQATSLVADTISEAIPVSSSRATPVAMGWYTFKVQVLFDLIERLDDQQELTENAVLDLIGTKAKSGAEEYRRFLRSGDLIPAKAWAITPELQRLAIALRQRDIPTSRDVFQKVPSFARFFESLDGTGVGRIWDSSMINRGAAAYMALGEVLLAGAAIPKVGYHPTPSHPSSEEFAPIALQAFKSLDKGEGLISTGAWLELLITEWGIHPEVSSVLLREASAAGSLHRSTEGSTTDTRHDDHKISVLRLKDGQPVVESVHLYRGDYLIPGKSSSSLRIGAR